MTRKVILALGAVAALLGTTSFTPSAEAGMRVGFGFPLGSFTPRRHESGGYSGGGYSEHRAYKKKPVVVAKPSKSHVDKKSIRVAKKAKKIEKEVAEDQTDEDAVEETVAAAETTTETTTETAAPVKTASITSTPIETIAPVTEAPATIPVVEATPAPAPAAEPVAEPKVEPKTETKKPAKQASIGKDCRKFIPAVGVTISVGCSK